MLEAFQYLERQLSVVFPVHPRTRSRFDTFGLGPTLAGLGNLRLTEPLGYLDFLQLMANARLVLTDSGGIQEETTVLGVPCLTLRDNTERPVTITHGTNRLVGLHARRIIDEAGAILRDGRAAAPPLPPLWDGKAAERIVEVLAR